MHMDLIQKITSIWIGCIDELDELLIQKDTMLQSAVVNQTQ